MTRAALLVLALVPACDLAPPPPLEILVIDQVSTTRDDDWFTVVNASDATVRLSDFAYLDEENDVAAATPFPAGITLGPGARHVQRVTSRTSGFRLARDEELWIWRIADERVSDARALDQMPSDSATVAIR